MAFCPVCGGEYEADVGKCPDCDSPLVEQLPPQNPAADPDAVLVEIFQAGGDKEALIIKGLLESEGIMCSLSSDIPHTVVPLNVDGLGAVRIAVSEEDAEQARRIISAHTEESDEK